MVQQSIGDETVRKQELSRANRIYNRTAGLFLLLVSLLLGYLTTIEDLGRGFKNPFHVVSLSRDQQLKIEEDQDFSLYK